MYHPQATLARQQKGLERGEERAGQPTAQTLRAGMCLRPLSSHLCLVQDLHTLMLGSGSLQVSSTRAHTVPTFW